MGAPWRSDHHFSQIHEDIRLHTGQNAMKCTMACSMCCWHCSPHQFLPQSLRAVLGENMVHVILFKGPLVADRKDWVEPPCEKNNTNDIKVSGQYTHNKITLFL